MQVKDFLQKVKAQGDQPLLFEFKKGQVVQGGYHVTEIKNAGYETIDCGNSLHTWKEVIIQVWVPAEAEQSDPHMPSNKFLKIWDVVDSRLALNLDAEVRIEYGDAAHMTSIYHVDDLVATEDGLVVQMAPPRTTCKPREILIAANGMSELAVAEACCSSTNRVETIVPLSHTTSTCCAPAQEAPVVASACCSSTTQTETVAPLAGAIALSVNDAKITMAEKQQTCC